MAEDKRSDFLIIFDGGSRGNPGDAYGSFLIRGKGIAFDHPVRMRFGFRTNNEAEYLTLLSGLETLLSNLRLVGMSPSTVGLCLQGDSKLVIHQVSGEWKTKNERLKVLNRSARELLSRFAEVKYEHRPRSEIFRILGH
jgi:ribonuclease HI